jgi:GNAT superfamily N-acetyltransferase
MYHARRRLSGMKIEIGSSPTLEDRQVVERGLRQHNDQDMSADGDSSFAVFLRDPNGAVIGGVLARASRGWLRTGKLWLEASLRGRGYGRQLMVAAEAEGRQRGCHSAYLDTFSFQMPIFYKQCGHEVFGTLEALPNEHNRFFVRKSLLQ